jgi:hypothetical protein
MRGLLAPLLVAASLLAGCRDWRDRVDPARVATDPVQENLASAPPIAYEQHGHRVTLQPRARYHLTAYAVETSRKLLDEWDWAVPLDVAVVWGPIADPRVLKRMKFHLTDRYVSYFWEPAGAGEQPPPFRNHIANNHLIPATDEVKKDLDRIKIGDLVTLSGQLVDLEIKDGAGKVVRQARTSLRRDDEGSGACEQMWVESVEIER